MSDESLHCRLVHGEFYHVAGSGISTQGRNASRAVSLLFSRYLRHSFLGLPLGARLMPFQPARVRWLRLRGECCGLAILSAMRRIWTACLFHQFVMEQMNEVGEKAVCPSGVGSPPWNPKEIILADSSR